MKVAIFFALVAVVAGRALDDDCATCKTVVAAVDAQLKSNATLTEIENTVNKICDAIPGISDQCKQYVKQYVPEIVDMIASKITPTKICDELHLCNNSLFSRIPGLNIPMGPGPVVLSPDMPIMQDKKQQQQKQQEPEGELCTICEFAITEIEKELSNNSTEAQIIAAVEKVCDILPSTVKDECKQLIEQEGPQIINLLINKADPKTVCTTLRLCTSSVVAVPVMQEVAQPEGELCTICEFAISTIEKELSNNSTEQEVIAAVEKVCDILPSSVKDQCKQLIEQEGPQIINLLINKADPKTVCTTLRLCTSLAVAVPQVKDGPFCPICKQVMTYVDSLLKQNATVEEIEAVVEHVCDYLPGELQSECKQVVEAYAPQIIQLLAQKLAPDQICAEIGLCSSTHVRRQMPKTRT